LWMSYSTAMYYLIEHNQMDYMARPSSNIIRKDSSRDRACLSEQNHA